MISHFLKFEDFTPDEHAPFEHEFARLASSQEWAPGSQEYMRERTIAMREEITHSFFCLAAPSGTDPLSIIAEDESEAAPSFMPTGDNEQLTDNQMLRGYQLLCTTVGLTAPDSVAECKKALKTVLVNIVDLLNVRRTGQPVKLWDDFEAFRSYTMRREHRIDRAEAKQYPKILASLLQDLRPKHRGGSRRIRKKRGLPIQGRVTKTGMDFSKNALVLSGISPELAWELMNI
ncbi:hypothetical protein MN608_05583 [Microdochium nivale]|nr:hypothetical protein MN608_05583 [Microdochium nivale]